MILSVSASADYDLSESMFLTLMVEPPITGVRHRVVQESLRTTPVPRCTLERDLYENPQRRVYAPKGFFTFDFNATIEYSPLDPRALVEDWDEIDPAKIQGFLYDAPTLIYTLPSRHCPSDFLGRMAKEKFADAAPGIAQVRAIQEWTHRRIHFLPERDSPNATASETVTRREGGRHDIAHLIVTFCRALGLPARYVSGYALGVDLNDFHAWAQVYLQDTWIDVDASSDRPRDAYIPIAVGRDAADVPILHAWADVSCRARSVFVERVR